MESAPKPEQLGVSAEIIKMAQTDQEAREKAEAAETLATDKTNQARLKQIIAQMGWPTKSKVGAEAAHAAWLLVQHADEDTAFQRECFEAMRKEGKQEVSLEDMAYSADRIRVNEHRPQLFGTQWKVDDEKGYIPEEIEDEPNLEKRRADAGMEPFTVYAQAMRKMYSELQSKQAKPDVPQ